MNRILFTITTFFLVLQLFGKGVDITTETKAPNPTSELEEVDFVGAHASLFEENGKKFSTQLKKGSVLYLKGFQLQITSMTGEKSGYGTMYIPSLNVRVAVGFSEVAFAQNGSLNAGEITALNSQAAFEKAEYSLEDLMGEIDLVALPFDVAPNLDRKKGFSIPLHSHFWMNDFKMTVLGGFGSFTLQAASPIEGDFFYFDKDAIEIDAFEFCTEEVDMPIRNGGMVDDFEFPIRILKGNPMVEEEGSYVTFSCDGLETFNLQALYEFPKSQLEDAANPDDTVRAFFTINSPEIGSFVASAIINPFEIAGVDDLEFTIDSAYFDYSDVSNPPNFAYVDPETGQAAEDDWKGFYMKKLEISLPPSVTSFNGGNPLQIGATDIVYDRGNGLSGDVYAYNLLDLETGNLGGWGIAVDTFTMAVLNNSMGDMLFRGSVFIPVCDEGDDIPFDAILSQDEDGNSAMAFVLDVAGEYNIPFLGDAKMTLTESSVAGVRLGGNGFEPYADFSGSFELTIAAIGSIPEITFPKLGFQNFKLNDIDFAGAAAQAQGAATGGLDKMTIGAFSFAGLSDADIPDIPAGGNEEEAEKDQKVGGFPVTIKDLDFISVVGTDQKKLSFKLGINLTGKGGGGISGKGAIGIYGKVNYAKIISSTPWEAVTMEKVDVASIEVEGKFGPATFEGGFAFISDDPVYGSGVKGAIALELQLGATYIEAQAVAQFGVTNHDNNEDYRYFFFDVKTGFNPGIPLFPGIELYGLGGGFYYNMDKSYVEIPDDLGAALSNQVDLTPGTSLSGCVYTPSSGSLGFNASVIIGLQGSPQTFCADVGLGIQMNYETMGIEKITLDGTMFILSKSFKKRREQSSVIAQVNMTLDFENGVMSAAYGFTAKAPVASPLITGNGQGALQFDINPDDSNQHKQYLYFGTPRNSVMFKFGISGIGTVNLEGYFMFGEDLPPPVPIQELHPLFAEGDFDNGSILPGGKGFAVGMRFTFPRKTFTIGPFKATIDAVFGFDASIKKYVGTTCANTGTGIGLEGWYAKGRAYAAVEASVSMFIDVWFFKGTVKLLELGVAAQLQAELPNPTWVKGELYVRARALGTISVSTKLEFEFGEKCEMVRDPSKILADIKVISDFDPSDKDEAVPVYNEVRVAFAYAMGTGLNSPSPYEDRLIASTEEDILEFFPMMTLEVREANTGKLVSGSLRWGNDFRIAAFLPTEILKPNTKYTANCRIRWRMKEGNAGWKDPENVTPEVKIITFTTGERPDKIAEQMVAGDFHLPGNGQRNYFNGYGKPMLSLNQDGYEYLFAQEKTKTLGNKTFQVKYNYIVRITDVKTQDTETIEINKKPGDTNNPRDLEYIALDQSQLVQKNKIYKFEVVGVPIPEENSTLEATTETVSTDAGEEGVAIETVSTKLKKQEPDPTKIFDIIYQFYFKTSKFDNFNQKLATVKFKNQVNSTMMDVEDYPGMMLPVQPIDGPERLKDHYLLFTVEEGFDKWDMQKLEANVHYDELATGYNHGSNKHPLYKKTFEKKSNYYAGVRREYYPVWRDCVDFSNAPFISGNTCTNKQLLLRWDYNSINTQSTGSGTFDYFGRQHRNKPNMGWDEAYQAYYGGNMVTEDDVLNSLDKAFAKRVYEQDDFWWGVSFPKKGEFVLTTDEVETGNPEILPSPIGRSDDNKMNAGTTSWDFAFVSKRNRGMRMERGYYATLFEMVEAREEFVTQQRIDFAEKEEVTFDYIQYFTDHSDMNRRMYDGLVYMYYNLSRVAVIPQHKRTSKVAFEIWLPLDGRWDTLKEEVGRENPLIIYGTENFTLE